VWNSTDSSVTISLKGWKFVDGQRVDAQSVIFWLNMMKAVGSSQWGDYVGGPSEFPGNVKSYSAAGPAALSLTIHLDGSYNPTWYLYNELSQITPMAEAWDVRSLTSPGSSGHCGQVLNGDMTGTEPAVVAACKRVWAVDTDLGGTSSHPEMAGNLDTYGTNPLWHEGTDGPWLLSAFDGATGEATFSPNPDYSGPQKPVLSKFVEVPYASTSDEYKALTKGGSSGPDVGYLPLADTPRKPPAAPLTQAGPNAPALAGRYQLVQSDPWAIEFLMENFDSRDGASGHAGKVFSQLYFRQALQELINQTWIIDQYLRGYGVPTYGPAPAFPPNPFTSGLETEPGGPYPFNASKAIALLQAHGWHVVPGGVSECVRPGTSSGECGAGIPAGTPLRFSDLLDTGGSLSATLIANYEMSQWAKAGIQVFPGGGFAETCVPGQSGCHDEAWDLTNGVSGWLFWPDYLPTGEQLFATGAGTDLGGYSSALAGELAAGRFGPPQPPSRGSPGGSQP
jgi:peptide/nickel transport system substrate-binding protein